MVPVTRLLDKVTLHPWRQFRPAVGAGLKLGGDSLRGCRDRHARTDTPERHWGPPLLWIRQHSRHTKETSRSTSRNVLANSNQKTETTDGYCANVYPPLLPAAVVGATSYSATTTIPASQVCGYTQLVQNFPARSVYFPVTPRPTASYLTSGYLAWRQKEVIRSYCFHLYRSFTRDRVKL